MNSITASSFTFFLLNLLTIWKSSLLINSGPILAFAYSLYIFSIRTIHFWASIPWKPPTFSGACFNTNCISAKSFLDLARSYNFSKLNCSPVATFAEFKKSALSLAPAKRDTTLASPLKKIKVGRTVTLNFSAVSFCHPTFSTSICIQTKCSFMYFPTSSSVKIFSAICLHGPHHVA